MCLTFLATMLVDNPKIKSKMFLLLRIKLVLEIVGYKTDGGEDISVISVGVLKWVSLTNCANVSKFDNIDFLLLLLC